MQEEQLFWVGIGASAGGLEALRTLVVNLPRNAPITYIVTQHLSPQHRSMLPQLIEREAFLTVEELKNGTQPKANTIYITPPSNDVIVKDRLLYLQEPSPSRAQPKPSVDKFLTSLGEEIEDHAIGIILSGTGSDGSHGMRAVRASGGITIVQDEDSSKYYGMPGSAVEMGGVDLILSPEEIGRNLKKIISVPRNLEMFKKEETYETVTEKLLGAIRKKFGVNFLEYKSNTILRRIERRMKARGYNVLDAYTEFACSDEIEMGLLYNDLMIAVTSFFRDFPAFEALEKILLKIIEDKNPEETIRIWVPGCCTGEEVYSIAILLSEALGGLRELKMPRFQIFGTDIDEKSLEVARSGRYPDASIENIPEELQKKYFIPNGLSYEIVKPIRDRIVFSRHDVTQDPPFLRMDLISCRNLLIYFNNSLQSKVLSFFHYALQHKGYLFLGKSETTGANPELFQSTDAKEKIFKRRIMASSVNFTVPFISKSSYVRPHLNRSEKSGSDVTSILDAHIKAVTPNALITNEQLDIKHIYGNIKPFSTIESGAMKPNIETLIKQEYRQEIKSLAFKALRHRVKAQGRTHQVTHKDTGYEVIIAVFPLEIPDTSETLVLVSFDMTEVQQSFDEIQNTDEPASHIRVKEMEQELEEAREHLQTVIEELETSNEELQSLNEELQSANEELQSMNEELETSNEELQSTNEELTTVNQEVFVKAAELTSANEDLDNIMQSLQSPLIVVDQKISVTRYNQAACALYQLNELTKRDILTSIPSYIDIPDLRQKIEHVMHISKPLEVNVSARNEIYILEILPFVDINGYVNGAVLVFNNHTDLKSKENKLIENEAYQRLIVNTIPDFIFVKDKDFRIVEANDAFKKAYSGQDIINKTMVESHTEQEQQDFLENDRLAFERGVSECHETITFPDGRTRILHTIKTSFERNGEQFILGIARDTTEIYKTQQELKSLIYKNDTFVESSGDGYWDWDLRTNYEYMSARFWEIFGYKPEEKEHHPSAWQDIIFEEDLKKAVENFNKHIETLGQYPYSQEVRYTHKDGHTVTVLCKGKVIEWGENGEALRMIGTHTDITQLKESERQLIALNEELSQYAYRTSHDLRAPVKSSIGMMELIKNALEKEDYKGAIEKVERTHKVMLRLDNMIYDILKMIRNTSDVKELSCFNVEDVIDESIETILGSPDNNIEIKKNISVGQISSYRFQFQSVFENLFSNAIKYADSSKEKLFIDVSVYEENKNIILSIRDNGIGIDEKDRDKLFTIFSRFHNEDISYGYGIGLYMVKKIVNTIQGDINYIAHDDGSEFVVTLPKL